MSRRTLVFGVCWLVTVDTLKFNKLQVRIIVSILLSTADLL
jgi:hypothetical protein